MRVVQIDERLLQMQQKMALTVVLIINKRNSWRFLAAFCGPARRCLAPLGMRDRLRLGGGVVYDSNRLSQAHEPHNSPSPTHVHRHRGGGFENGVKNPKNQKGLSKKFYKNAPRVMSLF